MSKLTKKQRKQKSRKLFKKAVRKIMRRNNKTKKNYGGVERQSRRKRRLPPPPVPSRELKNRGRSRSRSRRRRRRPPPIPFRMPPTPHTPRAPFGLTPSPLEKYNVRPSTPPRGIQLIAIKPHRSSNKVNKPIKWQLNLDNLDQLNPDKQFRKKRGNKMQEPE